MNLLADAAHNFTDGVVVGASFVVGGPRRGWAKTALILAHEIPQELGDFGALTHAGFTVARALFYNFLSALASVVGTAVALLIGGAAFVGREGGTEALSDGDADATRWMACADAFVAGGFAYAACGTAMAEMQRAGMGWRGEVARVEGGGCGSNPAWRLDSIKPYASLRKPAINSNPECIPDS